MKVGMNSRHCGVCEKSVIDFTSQSRAEIITYLLDKKDESVCGRMRSEQFDFHHSDIPVIVELLKTRPSNNAFLVLALVSIGLSACAQNDVYPTLKRDSLIETPQALQPIMGAMVSPQYIIEDTIQPVKCIETQMQGEIKFIKGEVNVLGKIAVNINNINEDQESKALKFAEKMPEFPGGIEKMYKHVNDFFVQYKKRPNAGTAYVRFIVAKSGKLTSASIVNIPDHLKYLEEDIIWMINKMPNWIPGENNGEKVNVYCTLPIVFK
jgi:hypothetical protein